MTENIGNAILFDIAGGYTGCSPNLAGTPELDVGKVRDIISEMLIDEVLDKVQTTINSRVGEIKEKIANELSNEMKTSFSSGIRSITNSIDILKKDVDEFKSAIRITKTYISFNKRRLVSVAEGKDDNDVITKKQLSK